MTHVIRLYTQYVLDIVFLSESSRKMLHIYLIFCVKTYKNIFSNNP